MRTSLSSCKAFLVEGEGEGGPSSGRLGYFQQQVSFQLPSVREDRTFDGWFLLSSLPSPFACTASSSSSYVPFPSLSHFESITLSPPGFQR